MPIPILPESNYVTSERNYITIWSVWNFYACMDTQRGCIPSLRNPPVGVAEPPDATSNEYYLVFGFDGDQVLQLKVFRLPYAFTVEDAEFLLGIYTDPDGKKHLVFKYGSPVDVPGIEQVWIVKRNGDVLYGLAPTSPEMLEKIGTIDTTFFVIENSKGQRVAVKPKLGFLPLLAIIGIAVAGATWWAIETHRADKEAEVKQYAIEKQFELFNKMIEDVKNDTTLAVPYSKIAEDLFALQKITWEIPKGLNPYYWSKEEPATGFDRLISWIKSSWQWLVGGLIFIIIIMKWRVIIDFLKSIFRRG